MFNIKRYNSERPLVMFLGLRGIGDVQGGIETHVTNLVRYLPVASEQIEVIGRSPYRTTGSLDSGLPRVRWLPALRSKNLETITHTLFGVMYAAFRRPELLHIHGIGPNFATPLARMFGLKVIATHHGADYEREKWGKIAQRLLRYGERQAVERANACISISPVDAVNLRQHYEREISYIPNGIGDMAAVLPGKTLKAYGLTAGRYIVNVARLVPEKRQIDLVEAFALADLPPDIRLLLIGGADHESEYTRRLRERAGEVPGVIMTGHMSGQPLAELFSNAGLFSLPSTHEGLPFALLEAMSYGRALALSDLPVYNAMGISKDFLFPVRNVQALADRLSEVFTHPCTLVDWSEILISYRWPQVAQETAALYKRVLAKN